MATIGQQLTAPEQGWKRYDDNVPQIARIGTYTSSSTTGNYGGGFYYTSTIGDKIRFTFIGSKFRLIAPYFTNRSNNIEIYVDNVLTDTISQNGSDMKQVLVYEKLDLVYEKHVVEIVNKTTTSNTIMSVDAIDIDEDGSIEYMVGSTLTSPEESWRRYDDNISQIIRTGTWTVTSNASFYGGNTRYSNIEGNKMIFTFKGTKIRLIGMCASSYPDNVQISIDGQLYETFSIYNSASYYQRIVYEKTGLSNDFHKVEITVPSGGKNTHIDAIDVDLDGYITFTIGGQIYSPEEGWKRYDDSDSAIAYEGTFIESPSNSSYWKNTLLYTDNIDDKIKFDFFGNQIRLIGSLLNNRSNSIEVYIDNILMDTFSQNDSVEQHRILLFEKLGLENKRHSVMIINNSTDSSTRMAIDAIDVNSDGRLLHLNEVINIGDLSIGKRIRCSYANESSGQFGVFGGLFKEQFEFIPNSSTNSPLGDFYFICVDRNPNGKWVLMADRNVQHSISWNTLDANGIASNIETPTAVKKKINGSVQNKLSNTSGVALSNSIITNGIAGKSTLTFEADIICFGFDSNNLNVIICSSNHLNGYKFQFRVNSNSLTYGRRYGSVNTDTWYTSSADYNFEINKSYHVALTENIITGEVKFYVNGDLIGASITSHNSTSFSSSIGNYGPRMLAHFSSTTSLASNAQVTNFRVWSVVRTDEQIKENYNKELTNKEEGLIANFTFGDSRTVSYSAVNGHSATIPQGLWKLSFKGEDETGYLSTIKLPSGGTSSSDKASEWEDYIVNSNLGNTIIPGSNRVWNWSGIYSLTSTTNSYHPTYRTIRGSASSGHSNYVEVTSTVSAHTGFRPMLFLEKIANNKYLIKDNDEIKTYKDNNWFVINSLEPTVDDFKNYGLDSLLSLDFDSLNEEFEILCWTDKQSDEYKLDVSGVPNVSYKYKVEILEPYTLLSDWSLPLLEDFETTTIVPSSIFTSAINPYSIKVTAEQSDGIIIEEQTTLTLYDTEPILIVSIKGSTLNVYIDDEENNKVQFNYSLNGKQIYPESGFTELLNSPVTYSRAFSSGEILIGQENTISVFARDEYGKESNVNFKFIGQYSGIMFCDEMDEYYSTDLGDVLKYLDLGIVIAGETTPIIPIKIKNTSGSTIQNISLAKEVNFIPDGIYLEISKTHSPFVSENSLLFGEVLNNNEFITFYVRLVTEKDAQPFNGEFKFNVDADIIDDYFVKLSSDKMR